MSVSCQKIRAALAPAIISLAAIMLSLPASLNAVPLKYKVYCKKCESKAERCSDDRHFEKCNKRCTYKKEKGEKDPIERCRNIHLKKITQSSNESDASKTAQSVGIKSWKSHSAMSCKERNLEIANNEMLASELGIRSYSEKEQKEILGDKCASKMADTSISPVPVAPNKTGKNIVSGLTPPPSDLPPPLPPKGMTGLEPPADVPPPTDLPPPLPSASATKNTARASIPAPPPPPPYRKG